MKNTKSTPARIVVAMLAVAGLVAGGSAYAFRGDGNCGPQAMAEMQRSPGEYAGKRLDKLHADLKLAPEQEAAWKAWSDPVRQQSAAMGDRMKERESMQKLPAPERMEKMLERMTEHQQKMEGHLGATRNFYNQLSAEQKKVFDGFRPFGGPRGEHGGRGGQPRGPAPQQNG